MSLGLAPPASSLSAPPASRAESHVGAAYSSLLDEQLLARFFREHEDGAFAALVERHGPLVYGVCRRVLHDANDAQDAFQATFLVLVRKGATLAQPSRLANWLFGVAYRTARKVRTRAVTRTRYEREADPKIAASDVDGMTLSELKSILDEEIAALPEKYALPLVLCYLEGKTNSEASAQLGCPEGSMSRRLARARELLRSRLVRRGLALSAALFASLFAKPLVACPPPGLVEATVSAGHLVLRGVPIEEVVSGEAASVAGNVVAGLTPPTTVLGAALLALAGLFLAAGVGAWQFSPPAGEGEFSVFRPASWAAPPIAPAPAITELVEGARCTSTARLANPPPPRQSP